MSWNQVIMTKVGEELLSKMLNGSKLTLLLTRVNSLCRRRSFRPFLLLR